MNGYVKRICSFKILCAKKIEKIALLLAHVHTYTKQFSIMRQVWLSNAILMTFQGIVQPGAARSRLKL
ncbi:hypothetical protein MPB2EB_0919 [Mycoavidus sp. B2-EB]|nr:hypothetical protein MPB2EB_0919 [Mycoavidus sp. B2-EB]